MQTQTAEYRAAVEFVETPNRPRSKRFAMSDTPTAIEFHNDDDVIAPVFAGDAAKHEWDVVSFDDETVASLLRDPSAMNIYDWVKASSLMPSVVCIARRPKQHTVTVQMSLRLARKFTSNEMSSDDVYAVRRVVQRELTDSWSDDDHDDEACCGYSE